MYYLSAWDHYLNSPWHVSNTVHFSHSVNVNNTNSRPYWPQQDASEESKDFAFGMANLFRQTGALLSITSACIWLWSDTGKNWNMVICRFWKSLFVYSIMLKPVLTWVSQTLFSLSVCQSVTHHNMLFRFPDESSELDIIQSESEYSMFQTVCVGFCQFMQTWFSQVQKPLFFSLWAVRRWLCAMGEPLLKKHRTTVEPNETEPDPEPALLDLDKGTSNTAQTGKGQSGPNTEDQQIPRLCGISRSWPIRFKKHTQDELNRVIPPDHGYWREDAQHDPNCFCWICDFLLERQADDLLLYDYSN